MTGYEFILTAIDVPGIDSYELIPGYRLKKANDQRISKIKDLIKIFDGPRLVRSLYENNPHTVIEKEKGSVSTTYTALAPKDWRYWIVELDVSSLESHFLEDAFSLINPDLQFGFTVYETPNEGFSWHAQEINTFFNDKHHVRDKVKVIQEGDLKLAVDCFYKIKDLSVKNSDINRALVRRRNLRSVPHDSDVMVIGLVSIIETLITHAPAGNDPTDSLSRQIHSKMTLAEKRFKDPLITEKTFGDVGDVSVWKKIYGFSLEVGWFMEEMQDI
jgi:hypothetical protein